MNICVNIGNHGISLKKGNPVTSCPGMLHTASFLPPAESGSLFLLQKFFQLIHESVDIFELPVYGSKTHIGNRVQILQPVHHQFAYYRTGDLLLFPVKNFHLHLIQPGAVVRLQAQAVACNVLLQPVAEYGVGGGVEVERVEAARAYCYGLSCRN